MAGVSALRLTLATCSEIPMGKPLKTGLSWESFQTCRAMEVRA
jgi:hypothetical protein